MNFKKYRSKPTKTNQEHFHQYLKLPEDNGVVDWKVSLIGRNLGDGKVSDSIN